MRPSRPSGREEMNGLEMREAIRTGADVFTSTEHLLAGRAQEKKKDSCSRTHAHVLFPIK